MPLGELSAERLVPVGRHPEPMIQMGQPDHGEPAVASKLNQQTGERHRVRPARQPTQHSRTRGYKPVVTDGLANPLMKTCHVPRSQLPNSQPQLRRNAGIRRRVLDFGGAGGRTRTADPALMRRVL